MGGSKIGEKPEKKILNPQEKLAAINRVNERGESKAAVARDLGIPESTLRGWCKNSLRINYQSNRSSPDTDDALKLSPTNNPNIAKRKSLMSSNTASSKKRGRRPTSPNSATNHLLMTTSTLTELNRLKSEYGLSRTNDYLTQSLSSIDNSNSNSLDAAMRGWALQMQMLLQASMAASTSSDINTTNPLTTQGNFSSSSLLTTSTNTTSSMINQLWAPLIESSPVNNSMYPATITTPSTSSTLPLNLNFPTTSQISSNSLLMSYLPNNLLDTATLTSSTIPSSLKSPKYNLSPHYQTPKCPWKTNGPSGYVQNFLSSASSSGSMSPKSRTSINSHGFNDVYYGTDEETPILTNLSPSNDESSSDSLPMLSQNNQAPMDFSNHPTSHTQSILTLGNEASNSELQEPKTFHSNSFQNEPLKEEPHQTEMSSSINEIPQCESSENSNKSSPEESSKPTQSNDGDLQKKGDDPPTQSTDVDDHRKKLESVLETVFQVTNNNTIVSLGEEQKSISLAEAIECGDVFLRFLETAEDPNVTASQITQFRHILTSIKARCAQKSNERKPKVSRK